MKGARLEVISKHDSQHEITNYDYTYAGPMPRTMFLIKVDEYWHSASTFSSKISALICAIASLVKSGNGSVAACGEIPCPFSPICSIVYMDFGGWKFMCLAGSKDSLSVVFAPSIRDRGSLLDGLVAF